MHKLFDFKHIDENGSIGRVVFKYNPTVSEFVDFVSTAEFPLGQLFVNKEVLAPRLGKTGVGYTNFFTLETRWSPILTYGQHGIRLVDERLGFPRLLLYHDKHIAAIRSHIQGSDSGIETIDFYIFTCEKE